MPTEQKSEAVEELRARMERCVVVIATDYTGLPVSAMTGLRRTLRQKDVQYLVVKNTLAHLAADAAGKPAIKGIIQGPTGLAFGYGDPAAPAKALSEIIRSTRLSLTIRGAVIGNRRLSVQEVDTLATLPSREVLISQLLGQLQGPIAGLVYVLNAPISGLARVLKQHSEQIGKEAPAQ